MTALIPMPHAQRHDPRRTTHAPKNPLLNSYPTKKNKNQTKTDADADATADNQNRNPNRDRKPKTEFLQN